MFLMPGSRAIKRPRVNLVTPTNALVVQRTYSGTSDPGASNDITQGYAAGSFGINTATGRAFVCRSNAAGAAVWWPIGGSDFPGYQAGKWYPTAGPSITATGATVPTGTTAFAPFIIRERCTVEAIGVTLTTNIASGNLQLALYQDSGSGAPGTFIDSTPSISTTSTGTLTSSFANGNHQLEQGIFWTAIAYDSTAGGHAVIISTSATTNIGALIAGSAGAAAAIASTAMTSGYSMAQTFGTWGNASGLTALANKQPPACALQIASVP